MNGFLPDYSMQRTQNEKRRENTQRQKMLRNASTDPRLDGGQRAFADLTADELGGEEVDPITKMLAGKRLSEEQQLKQAAFQGKLRQAAQPQQDAQSQMPPGIFAGNIQLPGARHKFLPIY